MRCAYCKNDACCEDALGLPACAIHRLEADAYLDRVAEFRRYREKLNMDDDDFLDCDYGEIDE